ncbi:MAG: YraN family protein [Paramuribaculum sp.]|nr:YraN family protein [Paramuribaculum sp.]
MASHNELGKWGEQIAKEYLITKGYAVMDSNLHIGHKEIDIIATKGTTIAFIEVKTRHDNFIDPAEAIDAKKIRNLTRAADSFIRSNQIRLEPRFDAIIIIGTPTTSYTLEHIPDAFYPPLRGAF